MTRTTNNDASATEEARGLKKSATAKASERTHELAGCCAMGLCGPEAAAAVRAQCAQDELGAARVSAAMTKAQRRIIRNQARRERDQAMRDIGMVKVRGALGGTFWE